jgi:uncharacterized protein (DUF2141 family)
MRPLLRPGPALASLLFGVSAQAADLKVMINNVTSSSGTIMVGLYDSAANYERAIEKSAQVGLLNDSGRRVGVALRAVAGMQSVVFTNLTPGAYAVIVFHDENDNGKLDGNSLGMPTEAYAFSNNARGLLSAPGFKDAAVVLDQGHREIKISLIYPRRPSERP